MMSTQSALLERVMNPTNTRKDARRWASSDDDDYYQIAPRCYGHVLHARLSSVSDVKCQQLRGSVVELVLCLQR